MYTGETQLHVCKLALADLVEEGEQLRARRAAAHVEEQHLKGPTAAISEGQRRKMIFAPADIIRNTCRSHMYMYLSIWAGACSNVLAHIVSRS